MIPLWLVPLLLSPPSFVEPRTPPPGCGTPALAHARPRSPVVRGGHGGGVRALGAAKATRDLLGVPNVEVSANFAVRWGNGGGYDAATARTLLDTFEFSWAAEIEDRGWRLPDFSDTTRFNVYIGGTGDGVPDDLPGYSYQYFDDDGFPYVVLDISYYDYGSDYIDTTASHEFFHAIQSAIDTYYYEGNAAWLFEATADWMAEQVYPDNENNGLFVAYYLLVPQLSVQFFDDVDSGDITAYHQYGASVFPQFLTERYSEQHVFNAWVDGDAGNDPMNAFTASLAAEGEDVREVFTDFAAANVLLDYDNQALYREWLDSAEAEWPDVSAVVGELPEVTSADGLVSAPAATEPQRFAYNTWTFAAREGTWRFLVVPDAEGSRGAANVMRARLVIDDDAGETLAVDTGSDGGTDVSLQDAQHVTLVVANVSARSAAGETFGYRVGVQAVSGPTAGEEDGDNDATPAGAAPFGCAAGTDLSLALSLLLLGARRRGRR